MLTVAAGTAAAEAPAVEFRTCLVDGARFRSEGAHNRVCPRCRDRWYVEARATDPEDLPL